ncbi:hypothetical protein HRbin19_01035 [bacterium HR19]|nr:hypothetical protein HRbin19_01035 [bacterium HR19]
MKKVRKHRGIALLFALSFLLIFCGQNEKRKILEPPFGNPAAS